MAAAESPGPISFPPSLATRFRPGERLGAGAFSVVYRAHQTELGRRVVVKLLALDAATSADSRARFLAEARILARMRHPHVLALLEHGLEAEVAYVVYPDEGGVSLKDWIRGRPSRAQPLAEATRILDEILQGLDYLHAKGVIHRDLKPANLLVTQDGSLRIFDFGLARDLLAAERLTKTDTILGTPGYMAPDQIRGSSPDPRDDLYAWGIIAYELLTGGNPFMSDNLGDVFRRQLDHMPDPLRTVQATIPEELSVLVADCLAKPRGERPGSALEALERLRGASREEAQAHVARPGPAPVRAGSRVAEDSTARSRSLEARRRARHGWLVGAVVGLALPLGAWLALRGWPGADPGAPAPHSPPRPAWADRAFAQAFEDRLGALSGDDLDRLAEPMAWPRLVRHLDEQDRLRSWLRLGGPATDPPDEPTRARLLGLDEDLRAHGLPALFGPWLEACPAALPTRAQIYGFDLALAARIDGLPLDGWLRAAAATAGRIRRLADRLNAALAGTGDHPPPPAELKERFAAHLRSLAVIGRTSTAHLGDLAELAFRGGPRERRLFLRWAAPLVEESRALTTQVALSLRLEPGTAELAAIQYASWTGIACEGNYGAWAFEDPDVLGLGPDRSPAGCLFRALLLIGRIRIPGQATEEYARLKARTEDLLLAALPVPPGPGPAAEAVYSRCLVELLELRLYGVKGDELGDLLVRFLLPVAARCPAMPERILARLVQLEERMMVPGSSFAPAARLVLDHAARPDGMRLSEATRAALGKLAGSGL